MTHKRRSAMIFILVLGILLGGCSARPATYKDGLGHDLVLKGSPKRIVSLSPALTEMAFTLGVGERMVGVSNYCNRPPEAQSIEKVGDAFSIDFEKLVSLKPDLVLIAGTKDFESQPETDMKRLGIPFYSSGPSTIREVLDEILRFSEVLGVPKKGAEVVAGIEKDLADTEALYAGVGGTPPTVFVAVDPDLWTVGPNSFISDVLLAAGAKNVLQDVQDQYLQVSMEDLLIKDPDAIIVAIPEDWAQPLLVLPGWENLRAVKEGRVFFVDPDLISRPGPGVIEGIKDVAEALWSGSK